MTSPPRRRLVHRVSEIRLGEATGYDSGILTISEEDARACVADPALGRVRIGVACPGDSVRIVKPLDVVEPRTLEDSAGFPGFLDAPRAHAPGDVHVLAGGAVLAAGCLPRNQEGIIDLSGPAAERSPFGSTCNVVVEFERAEDAAWLEVDRAVRRGLLRLASRLARAATEAEPDEVVEVAPPTGRDGNGLPRVGVVTNLQTQGEFKDVFVYGRTLADSLPTLLDPGELEVGAIVSGQYGHPGLRNPTYLHQNNPVVAELMRRDGDDVVFAGLVITPEPVELGGKEHVSAHVAALCRTAGFDAAIVTKEGGGNADNDLSLKIDALADVGIEAVGIYAEMAGPRGADQSLVAPPEHDAGMVSTGNYDERLEVPAVERSLGGERVDIADAPATGAMELPTAAILCSISTLGMGNLTCAGGA